jgi:hypothetical protein
MLRTRRLTVIAAVLLVLALALTTLALPGAAGAQTAPSCDATTAAGFRVDSRDGFLPRHRTHFGSEAKGLVVIEGWLNTCRDGETIEGVSASGKSLLVFNALRVAQRVALQRSVDDGATWVDAEATPDPAAPAANSAGALYLSLNTDPDDAFADGNLYRAKVRVLIRWRDNTTSLVEHFSTPFLV